VGDIGNSVVTPLEDTVLQMWETDAASEIDTSLNQPNIIPDSTENNYPITEHVEPVIKQGTIHMWSDQGWVTSTSS